MEGSAALEGLRERVPSTPLTDEASKKVRELNDQEAGKLEQDRKTYGRTPDGTGASYRTNSLKIHMAVAARCHFNLTMRQGGIANRG